MIVYQQCDTVRRISDLGEVFNTIGTLIGLLQRAWCEYSLASNIMGPFASTRLECFSQLLFISRTELSHNPPGFINCLSVIHVST